VTKGAPSDHAVAFGVSSVDLVVPPHRDGGQALYIESPMVEHDRGDDLAVVLDWVQQAPGCDCCQNSLHLVSPLAWTNGAYEVANLTTSALLLNFQRIPTRVHQWSFQPFPHRYEQSEPERASSHAHRLRDRVGGVDGLSRKLTASAVLAADRAAGGADSGEAQYPAEGHQTGRDADAHVERVHRRRLHGACDLWAG
jgi:hypothetical protein